MHFGLILFHEFPHKIILFLKSIIKKELKGEKNSMKSQVQQGETHPDGVNLRWLPGPRKEKFKPAHHLWEKRTGFLG